MFSPISFIAIATVLSNHIFTTAIPINIDEDVDLDLDFMANKMVAAPNYEKSGDLHKTKNFLYLTPTNSTSRSSHLLTNLRNKLHKRQNGIQALIPVQGQEYMTRIQWANGNQLSVIVDTGSSDTWLINNGFQCVDANNRPTSQSTCNFGPTFSGGYKYGQVPNQNFNISYGDGEFVTGTIGRTDVTIAGLTVRNQTVALGNSAYWFGNGQGSGLLGLAFSSLTSAYAGTNPRQNTQRLTYDPLFTSMYKQRLVSPLFSLAIQRGNSGGYIAFGGLPPVSFTNTFTTTPIQTLQIFGANSGYTFYTINVQSFVIGVMRTAPMQAIVDSGTTLNYLPTAVAAMVNAAFVPPAMYLPSQGAYFVACNAIAPRFGTTINGTVFETNKQDLIFQNARDPTTGMCLTGVQDGGTRGPFILGDVFLQNVIAVFDLGANQMRFAPHVNY